MLAQPARFQVDRVFVVHDFGLSIWCLVFVAFLDVCGCLWIFGVCGCLQMFFGRLRVFAGVCGSSAHIAWIQLADRGNGKVAGT